MSWPCLPNGCRLRAVSGLLETPCGRTQRRTQHMWAVASVQAWYAKKRASSNVIVRRTHVTLTITLAREIIVCVLLHGFSRRRETARSLETLYNWVYFVGHVFSTGGSDSSVSDGLPMHLIYAPEGLKMVRQIRNAYMWCLIVCVTTTVTSVFFLKPNHNRKKEMSWRS